MTPGEWDAFAAGISVGGVVVLLCWGTWRIISRAVSDWQVKRAEANAELEWVRREQLKQEIRAEISKELGLDDTDDEVLPEEVEDDAVSGRGD
jgi:hypothetical protein